jgi:hypothetical protein
LLPKEKGMVDRHHTVVTKMNSTTTEIETALNEESDSNVGSEYSEKNDNNIITTRNDISVNQNFRQDHRRCFLFLISVVAISIIILSLSNIIKESNIKPNNEYEEVSKDFYQSIQFIEINFSLFPFFNISVYKLCQRT